MSRCLRSAFVLLAAGFACPVLAAPAQGFRSATIARDIGGFTLGMSVREAKAVTTLTSIGGYQFDATYQGLSYNFEVTPKGRIFRITTSQKLGTFAVDYKFTNDLAAKLFAKYGQPSSRSDDTFSWELIEPVRHLNGQVLPFKTMWMSAIISHDGSIDDVSLDMTIIDFRILWQDKAAQNRGPRDAAAAQVAL